MRLTCLAILSLFLPAMAQAKDLSGRVAFGVDQTMGRSPALSIRYGVPTGNPLRQIQIEGDFSVDLTRHQAPAELFIGGRVMYAVAVEDELNFYLSAGMGGLNTPDGFTFRLQPGCMVDAFPFGLENLGITGGFGLDLDLGETTGIATNGAVMGGFHYWF
jgi:hypothetical protein